MSPADIRRRVHALRGRFGAPFESATDCCNQAQEVGYPTALRAFADQLLTVVAQKADTDIGNRYSRLAVKLQGLAIELEKEQAA